VERNITIIDAPVTNSADVYQAAQSLVGKVDAIYVPLSAWALLLIRLFSIQPINCSLDYLT
jgi:ABC-type uncharacterized transport system substrate-binding protein